ncbi:hypothetical protein SeLEV6574_g00860 [Synchytrium endobioticum]|nr:hypothetical protein SeLEV6574_g00860 [Synchytrium endobioticum]
MAAESTTPLYEKPFTTSASLPDLNLFLASATAAVNVAGVPPAAFNSAHHSPLVSSQYDDTYQGPSERNIGPSIGLGVELQNELPKPEPKLPEGEDVNIHHQHHYPEVDPSHGPPNKFDPMMGQQPGSVLEYVQQYSRHSRPQKSQSYRPNHQHAANQQQRNNMNQIRFRNNDASNDIWRHQPNSIMVGLSKQLRRNQLIDIYQQHPLMLMDIYGNPTGTSPAPHNTPFQHSGNPMMICRYFLSGYCSRGDHCNFSHSLPGAPQSNPVVRSQSGGDGQFIPPQLQLSFAPPLNTFPYGSYESQTSIVATPLPFTYNMTNMAPPPPQPPPPPPPMAGMPPPHLKLPIDRVDMALSQSRPVYSTNVPFASQQRLNAAGPQLPGIAPPMGMSLLQHQQQQQMQQPVIGLPQGPPPQHHQHQLSQQRRRMPYEEANRFMGIPLDELAGAIYAISRDQHGCRYLQSKLEEHNEKNLHLIFSEIYPYIGELMTDAFANYLCQKIFQYCSDEERVVIVDAIAPDLVRISMNSHGTRAVQKLLDVLGNPDQIRKVVLALSTNVVALMKDLNGNHVIQKCLSRMSPENTQFIYNAATENCVDVATHRHGCCVLQRCIDSASEPQKVQLVNEISRNALVLVQNEFANYVVQYVLEKAPSHVNVVSQQLLGNVFPLSSNKYSSNVIEKCIKLADAEAREAMIAEILYPEKLEHLVSHPIGNYCVQTALDFAEMKQRHQLFELLQPLLPSLRNSTCGKRIQSKLLKST